MSDTTERPAIFTPDPDAAFPAITSGDLEVRLARNVAEIDASQALRYRVFYEERAAKPIGEMAALRRDFDSFDPIADHLLVLDHGKGEGAKAVVGTYRLLRRSRIPAGGSFYTASEYDIAKILAFPGEIMELGRSCVDVDHRNRPTMQLLWRGIAAYVFRHDITLMFGCASLPGTDPDVVGKDLSYLYHHHLAPDSLRVRALDALHVEMNRVPADQLDAKRALAGLPPLIKGYLRLGGFVGDGAVVDPQFNTTDVCVIVQTSAVTDKYYKHYEREARGG
ncbi:GNAT family N-acetyltransferase [Thalassobaculum salexigens]|uniref:GNAT family N-acetyltransferase n=1 Tax=Thalassobaculum salexigens TaxID=455360 RepID=UPI00042824E0|nr:GNAT family N-acyltransferase [Thalassobaculum salexigens]